MDVKEILWGGGGLLFVILSLVEIAPIKLSPWSWIAKRLGRAFNAAIIKELETVKESQEKTRKRLEDHIDKSERREADNSRARILRFNNEIMRDIPHTEEEFVEILKDMDEYERYCREHPDYENNRAVHAIANIERVYDVRLEKHDFLQ